MLRRAQLDAPGTLAEVARQLGVSISAISKIIKRAD
jgi:DNA-binding Lrp family transcriptional regulator